MSEKKSMALYKKGVEAWNIWANDMLAKKAKLVEDKQWQITASGDGANKETKEWIAESEVDFSNCVFGGHNNFKDFIFPNKVKFIRTTFKNDVNFEEAKFRGEASFYNAKFYGNAWLKKVIFSNNAVFDKVEFSGYARFHEAIFNGDALFDQISFKGFADFSGTQFKNEISFIAIHGNGYFSFKNTKFYLVPDFNQAHFTEAPQFDNSDFSKAINSSQSEHEDNVSSKWRSLKRLANQGHDHERELLFFAEEIKSQRGKPDKAIPCLFNFFNEKPVWPGGTRCLFGYFYQWLSDFGRSVIRPFIGLMFLGYLSYLLYLNYPIENKPTPACNDSITLSEAAIYLSARSALPFLPATSYSENINQSYARLYGKKCGGKANVPNTIVLISIIQTIFSTILIFLLLLALRNHFKIK